MSVCPACDVEIDVDEFDVEQGDELSCPECGANLEVGTVLPVELTLVGGHDDEEEDDDHAPDNADVDRGADDEGEHDEGENDDWEP